MSENGNFFQSVGAAVAVRTQRRRGSNNFKVDQTNSDCRSRCGGGHAMDRAARFCRIKADRDRRAGDVDGGNRRGGSWRSCQWLDHGRRTRSIDPDGVLGRELKQMVIDFDPLSPESGKQAIAQCIDAQVDAIFEPVYVAAASRNGCVVAIQMSLSPMAMAGRGVDGRRDEGEFR